MKTRALLITLILLLPSIAIQAAGTTAKAPTQTRYSLPALVFSPYVKNGGFEWETGTSESQDPVKWDYKDCSKGSIYTVKKDDWLGYYASFEQTASSTIKCRLQSPQPSLEVGVDYTLTARTTFESNSSPQDRGNAYIVLSIPDAANYQFNVVNSSTSLLTPYSSTWSNTNYHFQLSKKSESAGNSTNIYAEVRTSDNPFPLSVYQIDMVNIVKGKWSFALPEARLFKGEKAIELVLDETKELALDAAVPYVVEISYAKATGKYSAWTALAKTTSESIDIPETGAKGTRHHYPIPSTLTGISSARKIRWRMSGVETKDSYPDHEIVARLAYTSSTSARPRLLNAAKVSADFAFGSENFNDWINLLNRKGYLNVKAENWENKIDPSTGSFLLMNLSYACLQEQVASGKMYQSLSEIPASSYCGNAIFTMWETLALFPMARAPDYQLSGTVETDSVTLNGFKNYKKTYYGDLTEAISLAYDWNYALWNSTVADLRSFLNNAYGNPNLSALSVSTESLQMKTLIAHHLTAGSYWISNEYSKQSVFMNHYYWHLSPLMYAAGALASEDLSEYQSSSEFSEFRDFYAEKYGETLTAQGYFSILENEALLTFETALKAVNEIAPTGHWYEGNAYALMVAVEKLYRWIHVANSLTGENYQSANKFIKNFYLRDIHYLQPNMYHMNIGDMFQARPGSGQLLPYLGASYLFPTQYSQLMDGLINRIEGVMTEPDYYFYAYQFYPWRAINSGHVKDATMTLEIALANQPTTLYDKSSGTFFSRNRWQFVDTKYQIPQSDKNNEYKQYRIDTMDSTFPPDAHNFLLNFRAGPRYGTHSHADTAAITFWPFLNDNYSNACNGNGYTTYYGRQSIPHNTLMVYDSSEEFICKGNVESDDNAIPNSGGQLIDQTDCIRDGDIPVYLGETDAEQFKYGQMIYAKSYAATDKSPEIVYALADAAGAYSASKVKEYLREVVWIKQGATDSDSFLIIYDALEKTDASFPAAVIFNHEQLLDGSGVDIPRGETFAKFENGSQLWFGSQYTRVNNDTHGYYLAMSSVYPKKQAVRYLSGQQDSSGVGYEAMSGGTFDSETGTLTNSTYHAFTCGTYAYLDGEPYGNGRVEIYDDTNSGDVDAHFLNVGEIMYADTGESPADLEPAETSIILDDDFFLGISITADSRQWLVIFDKNPDLQNKSKAVVNANFTKLSDKVSVIFSSKKSKTKFNATWKESSTQPGDFNLKIEASSSGTYTSSSEGVLRLEKSFNNTVQGI